MIKFHTILLLSALTFSSLYIQTAVPVPRNPRNSRHPRNLPPIVHATTRPPIVQATEIPPLNPELVYALLSNNPNIIIAALRNAHAGNTSGLQPTPAPVSAPNNP